MLLICAFQIAELVEFLVCSGASEMITGSANMIDGGYTAQWHGVPLGAVVAPLLPGHHTETQTINQRMKIFVQVQDSEISIECRKQWADDCNVAIRE